MNVEARGGRWSSRNIRYRVTYCFDNEQRYQTQAFWRRWWRGTWDWVFHTFWDRWVGPHLMPRTYAKGCYQFWVTLRLPRQLDAYIWGDDKEGYVGHLYLPDGESWLCCFMGDTYEECREDTQEALDWIMEKAGMIGDSYTVTWINEKPKDRSYTA